MTMQYGLFEEPVVIRPPAPKRLAMPPMVWSHHEGPFEPEPVDVRPVEGARLPVGWMLVDEGDEVRLVPPESFTIDPMRNSPPRFWYSSSRPIEVAIAEAERLCPRIIDGSWSPYISVDRNYSIGRDRFEAWLEKWRANGWRGIPGERTFANHLVDPVVLAQFTEDLRPPAEAIQRAVNATQRGKRDTLEVEYEDTGDAFRTDLDDDDDDE